MKIFEALVFQEFVDAAKVLAHFAAAELIDFRHEAVEEITIVAHDNERTVKILQRLLEHVFRTQIEVVGRLVENEQVEGFEQEFENGQARSLTARKHFHLLRSFLAPEHEGTEEIANLEANFAFRHVVDGVIDGDFAVEERGLVLREVTNLYIVPKGERALVFELLHDALDERRLTFAVATDES